MAVRQGGASARALCVFERLVPPTSNRSSRQQYVGHRFTNGPAYSEYVAQELGVPLISYGESPELLLPVVPFARSLALFGRHELVRAATGGASISHRVSSRSGEDGVLPVDCIMDQIAKYSVGKTDERSTLFILCAGANDAYFSLEEGGTPHEVLLDSKECVEMLRRIGERRLFRLCFPRPAEEAVIHCAGAEYIVIPTLPPLGDNYPYSVRFSSRVLRSPPPLTALSLALRAERPPRSCSAHVLLLDGAARALPQLDALAARPRARRPLCPL